MSEVIIKNVKFKNVPDKRYGTKIGDLLTQSNVGMSQTVADYIQSDDFYALVNGVDIDWNSIEVEDGLVLDTTADLINWIIGIINKIPLVKIIHVNFSTEVSFPTSEEIQRLLDMSVQDFARYGSKYQYYFYLKKEQKYYLIPAAYYKDNANGITIRGIDDIAELYFHQDYANGVLSFSEKQAPDLSNYYTKEEVNTLFGGKVDKITGKGLSTNDYTNEDKTKVAAALTQHQDISGKADVAALNAEVQRAQTAEGNLQQLYESLSQSQPVPVTTLPATGEAGKIYRLAGVNSYADYMYNESDLTTPIKMAEYDNAIDDEPTAGSDNLVKSGGVKNQLNIINSGLGNPVLDESNIVRVDALSGFAYNSGGNTITYQNDGSILCDGVFTGFVLRPNVPQGAIHLEAGKTYITRWVVASGSLECTVFRWGIGSYTYLYPTEITPSEDIDISSTLFIGTFTANNCKLFFYIAEKSKYNPIYSGKVLLGNIRNIANREYVQVTLDSDNKVVEGITKDGTKKINVPTVFKDEVSVHSTVKANGVVIDTYNLSDLWNKDVSGSSTAYSEVLNTYRNAQEPVIATNTDFSDAFTINVNSQSDFDKATLKNAITAAVEDGNTKIIVKLNAPLLYFEDNHFDFNNGYFTDDVHVDIAIIGSDGCKVVASGIDYDQSNGVYDNGKYRFPYTVAEEKFANNTKVPEYRHAFISEEGKDISCFSDTKYACSEWISLGNDEYKMLLAPEDRNLSFEYIQISSAWEFLTFKVTEVDNDGYAHFKVNSTSFVGKPGGGGTAINGDYPRLGIYSRYRKALCSSEVEIKTIDNSPYIFFPAKYRTIHECTAHTFLHVKDERSLAKHPFKSISVIGVHFVGNSDNGYQYYDSERYDVGVINLEQFEQDYIKIEDCVFESLKSTAIVATATRAYAPNFACKNIVVRNNKLFNSYMGLISAAEMTSNVYVINNTLENVGKNCYYGGAIAVAGQHFLISNNVIKNFTYASIKSGHEWAETSFAEDYAGSQGIIDGNISYWTPEYAVDGWKWALTDGGTMYIYCRTKGLIIRRNIVYGVSNPGSFIGIQLDGGANKVKLIDNAILCSCSYKSFNSDGMAGTEDEGYAGTDNVFMNNIVTSSYKVNNTDSIKGRNIVVMSDSINIPENTTAAYNVEGDYVIHNGNLGYGFISIPRRYFDVLLQIVDPSMLSVFHFDKY